MSVLGAVETGVAVGAEGVATGSNAQGAITNGFITAGGQIFAGLDLGVALIPQLR